MSDPAVRLTTPHLPPLLIRMGWDESGSVFRGPALHRHELISRHPTMVSTALGERLKGDGRNPTGYKAFSVLALKKPSRPHAPPFKCLRVRTLRSTYPFAWFPPLSYLGPPLNSLSSSEIYDARPRLASTHCLRPEDPCNVAQEGIVACLVVVPPFTYRTWAFLLLSGS